MVKSDAEILIYPNPVSDILHIKGLRKKADLMVFNTLGKMILKVKGLDINVSDLSSGSYFIRIKTDQGTVTKLFLKK